MFDLSHPERPLRLAVVSPHFDDGVLSLGAAMAGWARAGHRVELVTVLGCDPDSDAPAGGWDQRAGFATEGAAARGRSDEDRRASSRLGASSTWFPFGSLDYERHAVADAVWAAIANSLDADVVLLPGSPLAHPDHAWLHALVTPRVPTERLALYAEQPYTKTAGGTPFAPVRASVRDRLTKWRAIREYRTQLPLLGAAGVGATARLALAVERIAWPDAGEVGSRLRLR